MAKWKPVKLEDENGLGDLDGLIGIEELVDYDESQVIYGNFGRKRKQKRKADDSSVSKKKKKSKKLEVTTESVNTEKISEKETHQQVNEKNQSENGDSNRKKKKKNKFESKTSKETSKEFSHLEEMKSWTCFGIQNEILAALYDKKFFQPTEIQLRCLNPAILGKKDILGAAETGSGKTFAFGIPIVNGILNLENSRRSAKNVEEKEHVDEEDWENAETGTGCVKVKNLKIHSEENRLHALILTPTRELAVQVKDHLTQLCKYTNIKVVLVVGGLAHVKQERLLKTRPEIVVATPGRLWELIDNRNVHLQEIEKIKYLAIDETDRMLEKGHFEELTQLLERINVNEKYKNQRQNFVFSATLTVVHDPPNYLKGNKRKKITSGEKLKDLITKIGVTKPRIIDITNTQVTAENLSEYKIVCKFEEKDYYLYYFLITRPGRTIIFCNSIGCVKRLANLLNILNLKPLPLHANMEQRQRLKNLDKFRENDKSLLLATDVAARGLDVPNVDHVIHYQVPRTAETYVHRSGRTARANNTGDALLLIEPQEHKTYTNLIRTLGRAKEIENLILDADRMSHIKKVINLTREIDSITLNMKKENANDRWYENAIKEMDLLLDDDELPEKMNAETKSKLKKNLTIKQKQLKELIGRPVLPKGFSGKFPGINFSKNEPVVRTDKLKVSGPLVLLKNISVKS